MENFPVISSILSADHVGLMLSERYGLSDGVSCTLLKAGINHSYLVIHAADKFIFRLYSLNWRSDLEINEELRLLGALKEKGSPVSFPLKDVSDQYIQYLDAPEGRRQGVLFSFAEGDKQLNFSADLHLKVGKEMAKIHQTTLNLKLERITYSPKAVLEDSFLNLARFLPADSEESAWMIYAKQYLSDEMNKADISQLRSGAVHLDIWFDNMNITKDGEVTIFDFDFCGNGWLAYDIAYYILQLHSTEKDISQRDLKIASFLKGYESVTKITDEEKRMLPVLGVSLYFFYLGVQCERYENWSNVFLNETYLKRFINLLVRKYFEENVSSER
ncbi:phosphotransferase enzyme family protein [Pedobacter sp. GR22-6]|uniref:phosphotransferase enzyme family protein n=1 Tax=Pedobacter sp. GR22-6 TaxID=3127957 RepID=UPI00307F939A